MSLNYLRKISFMTKLPQKSIKIIKGSPCLCFNNYHLNFAYLNTTRLITTKNNDSDKEIIYCGTLNSQIKTVKIFSLASSAMGIAIQPVLYNELMSMENIPVTITAYTFVGFFTFVTPVLLHLVAKKYITHLYYKPVTDSYVANTMNFFGLKKETEFKPEDVVVPDVPGMFTTFHINGKPFFMDPKFFENPSHYARIMGYDKPIDFKLNETPAEEKK